MALLLPLHEGAGVGPAQRDGLLHTLSPTHVLRLSLSSRLGLVSKLQNVMVKSILVCLSFFAFQLVRTTDYN